MSINENLFYKREEREAQIDSILSSDLSDTEKLIELKQQGLSCTNPTKRSLFFRVFANLRNDGMFSLQSYSNAADAMVNMNGLWGKNSYEDQEQLLILTDESFCEVVEIRAMKRWFQYRKGEISLEQCKKDLAIIDETNDRCTDYLLDFNYVFYNKFTDVFYTSRMGFKDDFMYVWGDKQWNIFRDLYTCMNFKKSVADAIEFVDSELQLCNVESWSEFVENILFGYNFDPMFFECNN